MIIPIRQSSLWGYLNTPKYVCQVYRNFNLVLVYFRGADYVVRENVFLRKAGVFSVWRLWHTGSTVRWAGVSIPGEPAHLSGDGLWGTDTHSPADRRSLESVDRWGWPWGRYRGHGGTGPAEKSAYLSGTSVCALVWPFLQNGDLWWLGQRGGWADVSGTAGSSGAASPLSEAGAAILWFGSGCGQRRARPTAAGG